MGGDPTEYFTMYHVPDEPKIVTKCKGCSTVILLADLWYGDYCCYGCYKINNKVKMHIINNSNCY